MRGARAVIENVAEMGIGGFGAHFGPVHEIGVVIALDDFVLGHGLAEAWPAAAGIEFVERAEQRFARNDIYVNAGFVVVPIFILKGWFCCGLLSDAKLH